MSLVTVISDERGFFAATGSGQLSREGENDRVKIPAFLFVPLRYLFFRLERSSICYFRVVLYASNQYTSETRDLSLNDMHDKLIESNLWDGIKKDDY